MKWWWSGNSGHTETTTNSHGHLFLSPKQSHHHEFPQLRPQHHRETFSHGYGAPHREGITTVIITSARPSPMTSGLLPHPKLQNQILSSQNLLALTTPKNSRQIWKIWVYHGIKMVPSMDFNDPWALDLTIASARCRRRRRRRRG